MAQTLEHNKEVTTVVPVTIPAFDDDLNIIQKLDDEPNDVGGLTAAELKAKFDEGNLSAQQYINNVLIPTVIADDLSEQARQAAEAERVANEIERVENENQRSSAEAERKAAEAKRNEDFSSVLTRAEDYATSAAESANSAGASQVAAAESAASAAESASKAEQVVAGSIPDNSIVPSKFSPESRSMMVRENLLDNWYFGNPVDQRGGYVVPPGVDYAKLDWSATVGVTDKYYPVKVWKQYNNLDAIIEVNGTEYVVPGSVAVRGYAGAGYTIDRWKFAADGGVARKTDGGIFLGCINQTYAYINHQLEILRRNGLNGKLCVLSALTVDGNLCTASGVWGVDALIANLGGENLLYNNPGDAGVNLRVDSTGVTLAAAKLELGPEQTLAHQENGVWVLNEIPDYNEQLLRCCMSTADSTDTYANNNKTAEAVGAVKWPQEVVDSGSIKDWALAQNVPTSAAVASAVSDMPYTGAYWLVRLDIEASNAWRKMIATEVNSSVTYEILHVNGTWGNWREIAFADKFLPLTGGTLAGDLLFGNGFGRLQAWDGGSALDAVKDGRISRLQPLLGASGASVGFAYFDGANWNGYDVLHTGNAAGLGFSRVITGTYSGSGKNGASYQNTLTPGWAPKAMLIYPLVDTGMDGIFSALFIYGQKGMVFYGGAVQERFDAVSAHQMSSTTWRTTNISWYSGSSYMQMNESGQSYGYIIWG